MYLDGFTSKPRNFIFLAFRRDKTVIEIPSYFDVFDVDNLHF